MGQSGQAAMIIPAQEGVGSHRSGRLLFRARHFRFIPAFSRLPGYNGRL